MQSKTGKGRNFLIGCGDFDWGLETDQTCWKRDSMDLQVLVRTDGHKIHDQQIFSGGDLWKASQAMAAP